MKTIDNPYEKIDSEMISLIDICGNKYTKSIILKILIKHPELSDSIKTLVNEAIDNQASDKINMLLENANFPCYPDHYQLKDFNENCILENEKETYKHLYNLDFLYDALKPNVYIHGLVGQGREELAIGLGDACCKANQKTSYITYSELLGIMNEHCTKAKSNKKYDELLSINCLIIDKFAETNVFDEEMLDVFTDFLNKRALKHRESHVANKNAKKAFDPCCTIITSSFEPAEFTTYMKQDPKKTLSIARLFYSKFAISIHVDDTNTNLNNEA